MARSAAGASRAAIASAMARCSTLRSTRRLGHTGALRPSRSRASRPISRTSRYRPRGELVARAGGDGLVKREIVRARVALGGERRLLDARDVERRRAHGREPRERGLERHAHFDDFDRVRVAREHAAASQARRRAPRPRGLDLVRLAQHFQRAAHLVAIDVHLAGELALGGQARRALQHGAHGGDDGIGIHGRSLGTGADQGQPDCEMVGLVAAPPGRLLECGLLRSGA